MIRDNICPFCGKIAYDEYVITKGHRCKVDLSGRIRYENKKQYFHRKCFEQNTIGAKKNDRTKESNKEH